MPPQALSKTSTTAADPGRSGSIASPPSLAGLLLDKHGRTTTSLILSKEVCIGFKVLTQFGNIQQWVNTSLVRLQWRASTTRLRTDCRIRTQVWNTSKKGKSCISEAKNRSICAAENLSPSRRRSPPIVTTGVWRRHSLFTRPMVGHASRTD